MGDTRALEEDPVNAPRLGEVWQLTWDGDVDHYLILEAVDVSLHRLTERRPEPGFLILSLERGDTTYLCCDAVDESIWRRVT